MFEFLVSPSFRADLHGLDKNAVQGVREKLHFLAAAENPLLFSKRLKGCKDIFRFRAGNYRIVFRLEKQKIILLFAKHRKDIYENL